jgi:hypothetical protein
VLSRAGVTPIVIVGQRLAGVSSRYGYYEANKRFNPRQDPPAEGRREHGPSVPGRTSEDVTAQARSAPAVPAPAIIAIAVLAALVTGRLFAEGHVPLALAIVVAAAYLPLLFLDFQAALAVWVGILFVAHLSALSVAPRAIAMLLVVGWLMGIVLVRVSDRLPVLRQYRGLTSGLVLFVAWLGLTRSASSSRGSSSRTSTTSACGSCWASGPCC